jgi:hypothetical protein
MTEVFALAVVSALDAGLALLVRLKAAVSMSVLAVLGFNVIQFALIELPLIALLVAADRARSLTEKLAAG